MAERTKWTESDVQRLIEALRSDNPHFWDLYILGEVREKAVQPDVGQWIGIIMHRLFPEPSFDENTDLLILFRDFNRKRLGLDL